MRLVQGRTSYQRSRTSKVPVQESVRGESRRDWGGRDAPRGASGRGPRAAPRASPRAAARAVAPPRARTPARRRSCHGCGRCSPRRAGRRRAGPSTPRSTRRHCRTQHRVLGDDVRAALAQDLEAALMRQRVPGDHGGGSRRRGTARARCAASRARRSAFASSAPWVSHSTRSTRSRPSSRISPVEVTGGTERSALSLSAGVRMLSPWGADRGVDEARVVAVELEVAASDREVVGVGLDADRRGGGVRRLAHSE